MKNILIVLALIISSTTYAQQDETYNKTLKTMFEISGSEAAYQGAITQMMQMFKPQFPDIPADIWSEMEKEFQSTSLGDLVEMLSPVYSKHLNQADLNDIIDFYKTPTGKKFAESTPFIMQESMLVGQKWGQQIGKAFYEKMNLKGYTPVPPNKG